MRKWIAVALAALLLCESAYAQTIMLYGESEHGNENILLQENALWEEAYHQQGFRHLFVEMPYYTAEYLNLWMQAEDDSILDAAYEEWVGTASYTPAVKRFYQRIKAECPETVFHGTDVGHQYYTTGQRFLRMLEEAGCTGSEQYRLAQAAVKQGVRYYANGDDVYRENAMAQNFRDVYEALGGEPVMGIYGSAHTGLNRMNHTGSVACMAAQLYEQYGSIITSKTLWAAAEPIRVDEIELGGKTYQASYLGSQNLRGVFAGYDCREFWRLENAYEDVKSYPKTGDMLPENNYPIPIETGQVFVIDYHMLDGAVNRKYYRADGSLFGDGQMTTEQFVCDPQH